MTFARRVLLTAGVCGILIIAPPFLLPTRNPQPDLYYGFLGAVLPGFLLAFSGIDLVIVALYLGSWRRTAPVRPSEPRYRMVEYPAADDRATDVLVLDFGRALERSGR